LIRLYFTGYFQKKGLIRALLFVLSYLETLGFKGVGIDTTFQNGYNISVIILDDWKSLKLRPQHFVIGAKALFV
jgi:hypothetical protein